MNTQLDQLKNKSLFKQQAYINGQWVDSDNGETIKVENPASGAVLGSVPALTEAQVKQTIEAAEKGFAQWRKTLARERADILLRWYELLIENKDDLALLLTLEQGKPTSDALGEISYGNSFVQWFAEEATRVYGDTILPHQHDRRVMVAREPIGVCAAITPWNFPNAMITRKAAPALAAGCSIIIKPPQETPFSALAMAELAEQAGVPKGVLNVVTGSARVIGAELTSNPVVRKLSFTGSTKIGSLLMSQCAPSVKKLSLELGGNAPFIVFDDADIDAAVEGALLAKFRNTGQSCVACNRFFVQAGIYQKFSERFNQAVKEKIKFDTAPDDGVAIGPLINDSAVESMQQFVGDAVAEGATIMSGGKVDESKGDKFFEATVLTDVTQNMKIANDEIFGPIATLISFSNEEEAIRMANDTEYGLAAYFYTRDLGRMYRVMEALEYGMVGVNTGMVSNAAAPFGGIKASGLGREGSKYGLDEYLELKYACIGGIEK